MKDLPLSIETFSTLRENDYLYVDKTEFIFSLAKTGKKYFLSRPRRFGKSLLISTIEELYSCNKELFKDLYIYDKWNWENPFPIIKIDFGTGQYSSAIQLKDSVNDILDDLSEQYAVELKRKTLTGRLNELIRKVSEKYGKKIVILIDEYDKAIINNIGNPETLMDVQDILHDFYGAFKSSDKYIEFLLVTGVSKFSGTSLFSGFNNPEDITLDYKYSSICGITQNDLERDFKDHINETAEFMNLSKDKLLLDLKNWYDGYSWDGKETVYNPNSLLYFFTKRRFDNYWFSTATPKFLMESIKYDFQPLLEKTEMYSTLLDSADPLNIDVVSLLFQTGYLTIKEKDVSERVKFILDIPNREVEESIFERLLSTVYDKSIAEIQAIKKEFIQNINNENAEGIRKNIISNVISEVPYQIHVNNEHFYHGIFLIWLQNLRFHNLRRRFHKYRFYRLCTYRKKSNYSN